MTRNITATLQILALVAQTVNALSPIFEGRSKVVAAVMVGIFQGASAIIACYYNPDGTSAVAPYAPPQRSRR